MSYIKGIYSLQILNDYFIHVTYIILYISYQFSHSLTLYDPMDCSTTGLPVHHKFLEFAQTHVH